jgi:hypothetical protein
LRALLIIFEKTVGFLADQISCLGQTLAVRLDRQSKGGWPHRSPYEKVTTNAALKPPNGSAERRLRYATQSCRVTKVIHFNKHEKVLYLLEFHFNAP